MPKDYLK